MMEIKYDLTEAEEYIVHGFNKWLKDFGSDLKREKAIKIMLNDICPHCGQDGLPCYCQHDD